MEKIIFFAIPMIVTIPFTLLLCRIRLALKLRISFATVLFSALVPHNGTYTPSVFGMATDQNRQTGR